MNSTAEKFIVRIKQDKKLMLIVFIGLVGILLLCLSALPSADGKSEVNNENSFALVQEQIEKELEELISTVEGAGKTKVLVSIECLEERTFAVNTESESSQDSTEYKEENVLIDASGGTDGLIINVTAPVIRGVGITCEGGGSVIVQQEITLLVSAALGVAQNKIKVSKMKE